MNDSHILPSNGSMVVRDGNWTEGANPGERVRTLVDDPAGYRTILSQVEAGPIGMLHAHDEIEQIYILEGDFFDDDGSYHAGDFVLRMPGTMHRAGSKSGCTMLLVYAPLKEAGV
jgi:anti-sigma factor ChrR (cupin superfamily)